MKKISLLVYFAVSCFSSANTIQEGIASWYCIKCNGGTHTASGIPLKDNALTAAHKTIPLGTKVRVTSIKTGKNIVVTITDRGPYIKGRIIDLTYGAFKRIRDPKHGITKVKIKILK